MSLRPDFNTARDAKLAEARAAGRAWVVTDNIVNFQTGMTAAANQGLKDFKLDYAVSYQSQDLRLEGSLWGAFKTGIIEGFATEEIMVDESTITLNTEDSVNTFITVSFSF